MKYFVLLTIALLSQVVIANEGVINPASQNDRKLNVFEMKHSIDEQSRYIQKLNKEMIGVENNLGAQNKRYLKMSESRSKLEEALAVARKNIDIDNSNLKKSFNETKSILMGILLNNLEKTESSSELLAKKILVQNLQQRMIELETLMKSNKENQGGVDEIALRLQSSMQTEKELVSIMNELEQRKKDIQQTILNENSKREDAQIKFDDIKNKIAMDKDSDRRAKKKMEVAPIQITEEIKIPSAKETSLASTNSTNYRSPLDLNQGIEHGLKGVTFKFQGKNEVLATRSGKIAYTGSLANYGNVVMIDHGNDTRTVLLGQFDFIVKNGDNVRDSQIVGYTNPKSTNGLGDGKIYFEVRKNNLAQNTYLLLDKNSLNRK